jgi:dethiobiotin synthetase
MKQYFVTGTDTGVGKTTVSCALLAAARARGLTVDALKPVETGCPIDSRGFLVPADVAALALATGGEPRGLHVFREPLAPSVAAELDGDVIDLELIDAGMTLLRSQKLDFLLVEGAGGLLVPLTDDLDMAGLAAHYGLPLLVVARDGLGTINHTLLTLEAAARRGLVVAGVILSAASPGTSQRDAERNALEIARRGGVRILGILPHQTDLSPAALARAAEAHLDLGALLADAEARE